MRLSLLCLSLVLGACDTAFQREPVQLESPGVPTTAFVLAGSEGEVVATLFTEPLASLQAGLAVENSFRLQAAGQERERPGTFQLACEPAPDGSRATLRAQFRLGVYERIDLTGSCDADRASGGWVWKNDVDVIGAGTFTRTEVLR